VDGILLGSSLATGSKERARGNDVRREERAGLGVALPGEERVEITAHVSHAGDAVGEKQGQKNLLAPRGIGVDACEMDMHVPKAREQEFSGGVDGARGFGNLDRCPRAHPSDVAGLDQNGLIRLRRAASGIDDGDVGYGQLGRGLRRGERWHDEKSHKQEKKYLSRPQSNAHILGDRAFLESYHKQRWAEGVLTVCRFAARDLGSTRQGGTEQVK